MPGRNHMGPKGKGPMTGKKKGFCKDGSHRSFDGHGRRYENPYQKSEIKESQATEQKSEE